MPPASFENIIGKSSNLTLLNMAYLISMVCLDLRAPRHNPIILKKYINADMNTAKPTNPAT